MTSRSSPAGGLGESVISDQMLSELSHLERADLLRRVQMLHASEFSISQRVLSARRWFIRFLAACCLGLIPWTIGLAVSLPRTYVTANWRVLWTGFDVVLLGCLAVTAWGLWKQRQILVPAFDHHERPALVRRVVRPAHGKWAPGPDRERRIGAVR